MTHLQLREPLKPQKVLRKSQRFARQPRAKAELNDKVHLLHKTHYIKTGRGSYCIYYAETTQRERKMNKWRRPMHDNVRLSTMRQKILKSTKQESELKNTITELKKSIEQTT